MPPDINRSDRDFTVEDGKVRFGLAGVKNVGVGAILEMLEARKSGKFTGLGNLLSSLNFTKVNRKVLEALIQGAAFDTLEPNRARLMAGLDDALERVHNMNRLQEVRQMSMFAGLAQPETDEWLPETPVWIESEKLAKEKEALGIYLSGHPLDAYRHILKSWVKVNIEDLDEAPDGQEVALGVVVTALKDLARQREVFRIEPPHGHAGPFDEIGYFPQQGWVLDDLPPGQAGLEVKPRLELRRTLGGLREDEDRPERVAVTIRVGDRDRPGSQEPMPTAVPRSTDAEEDERKDLFPVQG